MSCIHSRSFQERPTKSLDFEYLNQSIFELKGGLCTEAFLGMKGMLSNYVQEANRHQCQYATRSEKAIVRNERPSHPSPKISASIDRILPISHLDLQLVPSRSNLLKKCNCAAEIVAVVCLWYDTCPIDRDHVGASFSAESPQVYVAAALDTDHVLLTALGG